MSDLLGTLEIIVRGRLGELDKDLDSARKKAAKAGADAGDELEQQMSTSAGAARGHLSSVGKAAVAAGGLLASAGLAGMLHDAAMASSDLGEAQNANNVIFKNAAPTIDAFATSALKTLGLAEITVRTLAASVGGMFNAVGIESSTAAKMTTELITRARDVGSVFNESADVVTQAFGSALRGEAEPARRFGVFITADAIAAEALTSGLVKAQVNTVAVKDAQIQAEAAQKKYAEAVKAHGENSIEAANARDTLRSAEEKVLKSMQGSKVELDAAQKMQAAYQIVMRSTEVAAGDYANTQDSLANKTQRQSEAAKEASATLGESVAPLMSRITSLTMGLMDVFVKLPGPVQTGIAALLGIGVVAGPLGSLIGLFGALTGRTAAQAAANTAAGTTAAASSGGFFAMAAGLWATVAPFVPLMLAIGALIAIGVLLWKNWDTVMDVGRTVFGWLGGVAVGALRLLKDNLLYLLGPIGIVIKNIDSIKAAGSAVMDALPGIFRSGINAVIWLANRAIDVILAPLHALNKIPGIGRIVPDVPHIPSLDTGGVLTRPGVWMKNDYRPEVVAPVEQLGEMYQPDRGRRGDGGGLTLIVEGSLVTDRQVAELARKHLSDLVRTNGTPGF